MLVQLDGKHSNDFVVDVQELQADLKGSIDRKKVIEQGPYKTPSLVGLSRTAERNEFIKNCGQGGVCHPCMLRRVARETLKLRGPNYPHCRTDHTQTHRQFRSSKEVLNSVSSDTRRG